AFATFPRLILEMALLKAATLEPVIPIQELLEKIKTLETGAVHTPSLPWDASRPPSTESPEHKHPAPSRGGQQHHKATQAPQAAAPADPAGSLGNWERFVNFVLSKRPDIGSVLEHGSPLKQEPGCLEIGFPAASFFLTSAQDSSTISEIQALAKEFTGQDTVVRVKAIIPEAGETPQSLVEK